ASTSSGTGRAGTANPPPSCTNTSARTITATSSTWLAINEEQWTDDSQDKQAGGPCGRRVAELRLPRARFRAGAGRPPSDRQLERRADRRRTGLPRADGP